jgi:hypothetical protein
MKCDYCNEEVQIARLIIGEPMRYKCKPCQRLKQPTVDSPTLRIGTYSSPYNRDKD